MGIPVYFKTLITDYQDTILHKGKLNDIQAIFFDLNCLIHPCCRGKMNETEMIDTIVSEIQRLIDYVNPSDLIYIAIDGIAPKGKMKQQRMRRFKKAIETKYSDEKSWDTNAISPGTFFMKRLNNVLKEFIKDYPKKIILSDSDERGEGEHKILRYIMDIRNNQFTENICIYGLDADLIMLSLVSGLHNIYLLRERTEYNIEDTNEEFIYLKIDVLKEHLTDSLSRCRVRDQKIVIDDYIFMCFLLGNDFINHMPSLSLRYGGHDILVRTYLKLQERYQGYFCLIDRKLEHLIHLTFFKEFIQELAIQEKINLEKMMSIRDRQHKKIYNQYNELFHNFKSFIMESSKSKDKKCGSSISVEDIHRFQYHTIHDNVCLAETVPKMIENLPILFFKEERKILQDMQYDAQKCSDYMDSLIWTAHYYFSGCVHWRWATECNQGPLLKDLSKYLFRRNKIEFEFCDTEFTNKEQLSYIFPAESHDIHEFKIQSREYELIPEFAFNRYLWECHLEFI